ncbi:MAG TPA: Hsp20/alpha crystallin family protein [Thermoanaerobaculaceae bacterium]|nr:Hsp20/alpha crystallin family protein [Thermoanaerobaculaceae bacterium]
MRRRVSSGWELVQIQRRLDELLGMLAAPVEAANRGWAPTVDLLQQESRYVVRADLPGVDPSELVITLREQELRLAGRKLPDAETSQHRRCHQMERGFGTFAVEVALPGPVEPHGSTARLHDGVLEISLPRLVERRSSVYTIPVLDEGP